MQFEMVYSKIIDYFLLIYRSIKTNHIDSYKDALFEICGIFFVLNKSNYSWWMTYYILELENLQNNKPQLTEYLKKETFSINRTGKPFSRVAFDIALKQKSDAEVKNCLNGIMISAFIDINSFMTEVPIV